LVWFSARQLSFVGYSLAMFLRQSLFSQNGDLDITRSSPAACLRVVQIVSFMPAGLLE